MAINNSIVIVNHGKRDALRVMLHALKLHEALSTEAIVVDNASFDGSVEMLAGEFPQVRCVPLQTNTGFAAAANKGIDQSHGDVVVLCHSETIADTHVLSELADRIREGESRKVAAIVPRLVDPADREIPVAGKFPGLLAGVVGAFRPAAARRMFVPSLEHATNDDWAATGCIAIARGVFDIIGGFDERFFLYYHDADFAHRLYHKQFRILFAHDMKVTDVSEHPLTPPPHLLRILRKDQAKYFAMHAPKWQNAIINSALAVRGLFIKD